MNITLSLSNEFSKANIEEKLDLVRPFLAEDDGNVEL
jgi:hypothetical protein